MWAKLAWPLAGLVVGVWLFAGVGCDTSQAGRLNAPPQGANLPPSYMQDNFITMHDNALLADMSMSSAHFVPHTCELSGVGVARLKRYRCILDVYGGTLNYCGTDADRPLTNDRIEKIKDYLIGSGLAEDKFAVEAGLAGGRGMRASEAMSIRTASTFTGGGEEEAGQTEESGLSNLAGESE